MAVPSSGALSLLGIRNEIGDDNYSSGTSRTNISLKSLSDGSVETINTANASGDRPNGSAPHSMSEFYAYDHDKVSASYTTVPSDFTMADVPGSTVFSSVKTITITGGSGNTTVSIAGGSYGVISVALAASSGGPFNSYATSKSISHSSGNIFAKFKYVPNSFNAFQTFQENRTVSISNGSGATASFTITARAEGF